MYAKEFEFNKLNKHIVTKIYEFNKDGEEVNSKIIFELEELLLLFDENLFPNGFSDDVSFDDSKLIGEEYVVERISCSDDTGNPYQRYFEINNKTFFNEKKQKIRVEEKGKYENFVRTYIYDDDGFLIKENINNITDLFGYKELIYIYGKHFNDKLNRSVKLLKYSKYDDDYHVFFNYTRFGDLSGILRIENLWNGNKTSEEQFIYTYNEDGDWISKRYYENGELLSRFEREYNDFSDYFKKVKYDDNEVYDHDDLPF